MFQHDKIIPWAKNVAFVSSFCIDMRVFSAPSFWLLTHFMDKLYFFYNEQIDRNKDINLHGGANFSVSSDCYE